MPRRALSVEWNDVGSEPGAGGERERVDADLDLATPIGQVVVVPAAVRRELLGRPGECGSVDASLPQVFERPRGRGPRLPGLVSLGAAEESRRKVGTARPLSVRVLFRQQQGPEAVRRDPGARGVPDLGRGAREITLDPPAQRGVGVEQSVEHAQVGRHVCTLVTTAGDRKE